MLIDPTTLEAVAFRKRRHPLHVVANALGLSRHRLRLMLLRGFRQDQRVRGGRRR